MISQNNSCIKFYDCFNCSSYMEGFQSLCKWEENMCKEKTEKTIENSWFNLFNNCSNDSSSSLIMNEYCGKPTSNISIISNTISLKMKNDIYSPKNLYCKWQILNMSIETTVNFNFTLLKFDPNQDKYTFIIMFNKEKNLYIDISDSKYFQTDNIMSIVLHYTSNETKIYLPFYFNFQYLTQNMTTYSVMTYLMLIIASIIGFLFFVLCIRSFINNIFERFISANSNSNIEIHQVNTEFNNLKMFVNEFKPILYSENFNEFSCLCTICLENFIDNVEVIKLECKHLYHYKCLNDWLSKNQRMLKCPNCNNKIISRKSIEVNICSPDSNNNNVYLNT